MGAPSRALALFAVLVPLALGQSCQSWCARSPRHAHHAALPSTRARHACACLQHASTYSRLPEPTPAHTPAHTPLRAYSPHQVRQQRRRLGHQVRLGLRPVLGLPRVRREPSTGAPDAPLAAAHLAATIAAASLAAASDAAALARSQRAAPAWMQRHVRRIKLGMDHEVWLG